MIEMEKPRIECVEISEGNLYGKFVIEPLERGFGTTLGNSLRRILLSSLPGVAVSSVRIDGVLHEFSTIPGVKEDVTEIILNLKALSAKLYCDGPKVVTISAQGEQVVTAGDIVCDEQVEIINPDLVIATLNEDAHLNMEITLCRVGAMFPPIGTRRPICPSACCRWTPYSRPSARSITRSRTRASAR